MTELFVSLDVETLGPIPGHNPMIELGAACFDIEGNVVDTWHASLEEHGWSAESATMKWWHLPKNFPNLQRIQQSSRHPRGVMLSFSKWLDVLPGKLTPIAYPAAFDYMFVYWYLMYYVGNSEPLSFSCLDIESYVMAMMKKPIYRKVTKKVFPKQWFNPYLKHTHEALDDALEQGWMFIQAHRHNLGLPLLKSREIK